MVKFKLQFSPSKIHGLSTQYDYGDDEVVAIGKKAQLQGFLNRDQFIAIAGWKSSRPAKKHLQNDPKTIEEVTRFAFSTSVESLRLRSLTLLDGVEARTASAILHLCHKNRYPMMDVRAFWSLGVEKPPTNWLAAWDEHVQACRTIADKADVDMRTLDRALWAYSSKNQR